MFKTIQKQFEQFDHALIYTPGDNEWTDCYDKDEYDKNGWVEDVQAKYKIDRLNKLREMFVNTDYSLGKKPLKQELQSSIPEHENLVENRYWYYNDVLFATVHITGSANGFFAYALPSATEAITRRRSNMQWIKTLGETTRSRTTKAIVIASHAELFERQPFKGGDNAVAGTRVRGGRHGPYYGFVYAIAKLGAEFNKPVLFIHGDFHRFVIDRPFLMKGEEDKPDELRLSNITRLQTFGAPELKAVRVTVEPDTPWVFSFSPLY